METKKELVSKLLLSRRLTTKYKKFAQKAKRYIVIAFGVGLVIGLGLGIYLR